MLFIVFNFGPDTEWHVGDKFKIATNEVREVQADGHELDFVLAKFDNLPHSDKRVQRWYGDMAKFIVGNL